jgi:TctA family transporter
LAENALRQSLILSDGSMDIFFDFAAKPIAATNYVYSDCLIDHASIWTVV